MKHTTKLNLNKPDLTDYVSIADLNENADILDEAVGTLDEDLTTHLADYKYQIPTVVGKQIRINKLSNTNRLFFKLGADLTGDITISTDNGATEKPLVDFEGVQLTSLEKGFVEVVADANFFILRSRGISGVDKQALIDIFNSAEANESDLRNLFINSVNTVDTDGGINLPIGATWTEVLAQIPNIKTGKKWAGGTGVVATNDIATVQGLGFKPNSILLLPSSGIDRTICIYNISWNVNIFVRWDNGTGITNNVLIIGENGFTCHTQGYARGKTFNYLAFE